MLKALQNRFCCCLLQNNFGCDIHASCYGQHSPVASVVLWTHCSLEWHVYGLCRIEKNDSSQTKKPRRWKEFPNRNNATIKCTGIGLLGKRGRRQRAQSASGRAQPSLRPPQ